MNKLSKLMICIRYYFFTFKIFKINNSSNCNVEDCVIIGNGPSAISSLTEKINFFQNKKIFCVNNFAETNFYEQIKPNFYVLADPIFWEKEYEMYIDNFNNDSKKLRSEYFSALKNIRKGLINSLIEKTAWELNLFVPLHSKASNVFDNIALLNKNINVFYYSTIPINTRISIIRNFLYKLNIGMPTPQNVLIPAIFLALKCKFKNIFLMGADHSWHEELVLDNNNILGTFDRHFYDKSNNKKVIPLMWNIKTGETTKVHEQFFALYVIFRSHLLLQRYAVSIKSNIINMSKVTWIDAYPRSIHKNN